MARSNTRINPALADLSQDIAGAVPVELVLDWNNGEKTLKRHKELLAPYEVEGVLASSDSAGLSKLSLKRSLLEVMQLVSRPKEIIFAYGSSAGGRGVGVWAADNTQMFYSGSTTTVAIVEHMIAALQEIGKGEVNVGIGMHYGRFWEIGGGMYGKEAHWIEELTENESKAGQLLLSDALIKHVGKKTFTFSPALRGVQQVVYTHSTPQACKNDGIYPHPFAPDFYQWLRKSKELDRNDDVAKKYLRDRVVALVKVRHENSQRLLDNLTIRALANTFMKKIADQFTMTTVKTNGDIGIFVGSSGDELISFARELSNTLAAQGFKSCIGISSGEVLLFPMHNNGLEIAGSPVNIASKLAEDSGIDASVLVQDSVDTSMKMRKPYDITISGVDLRAFTLEAQQ